MDDENKKDILPSQRGRKRKSSAASNPHDSKRARKGSEFLRKIDVAVEEILSREMNHPPSLKNYMELYSDVYGNLVEGNIRERRRLSGSGESSQSSGSGCTAAEIYKRLDLILNKKLRSFVQDAKNLVGYDLLGYYTKQFSLYKSHVNFLDGIFGYMNRAWVKSINTSALQPKETIYSFCMTQWRTKVFNELNTKVAQALLNLIEEKRSAMEDKNGVIKTVIDSYIIMCEPTIGSKSTKAVEISLEIYTVNFEEPFLEKSKHFYSNVASEWISSKCIQNYVKETDDYLKGEEARGMELFHPSTVVKLVGAMLDAFVRDRAAILLEAMPSLLASNDIGSLKYLFGHLLRLESFSMDEVIATFKLNVVAAGQEVLTEFNNYVAEKKIEGKMISKRYVQAIVDIHHKYENIISVCLNNHTGFRTALDEACVVFVNQNAHTRITSDQYNLSKTPELLGRYSNVMLSQDSLINQDEFTDEMNKLFLVLKFTESKDAFEKFHNWHLLHRLIHKSSVGEDNEILMITKMKTTFGQDYSLKSYQLTQDAKVSEETSRNFKMALQEEGKPLRFDFHVVIFKNGSCRLPEGPTFNVAPELIPAVTSFNSYYGKQHEGRTLTWFYNKSYGELTYTTGPPAMSKKYTFIVSTYQMTILLLFNKKVSWTFDEIKESTSIDAAFLLKIMSILERTKLVTRNGDSYDLFESYKSNKIKHDINVPVKMEPKGVGVITAEDGVQEEVLNQRKFVLQAVMMRLMKCNQTMRHSDLISETIEAVKGRFKPNIAQIKRTIDCLIEKEYLKRDETEVDMYIYLS